MPLELELIRASEFIRLNPAGRFDPDTSKLALAAIARACRKRGIARAMLDLRAFVPGKKPVFTPKDLVVLVEGFCGVGFTRDLRLALLYSADPHGRARMFAFVSIIRGWNVRSFANFEEAMLWLSQDEIDDLGVQARGRPVRVRQEPRLDHPGLNAVQPSPPPEPTPTVPPNLR